MIRRRDPPSLPSWLGTTRASMLQRVPAIGIDDACLEGKEEWGSHVAAHPCHPEWTKRDALRFYRLSREIDHCPPMRLRSVSPSQGLTSDIAPEWQKPIHLRAAAWRIQRILQGFSAP